jgi:hypothetical protein
MEQQEVSAFEKYLHEVDQIRQDSTTLAHHTLIRHPLLGKIPFELYDFQHELLRNFKKHRYNIILKGRQLGITTVVAYHIAWLMNFFSDKEIVIISKQQSASINVLKKVKLILRSFPAKYRSAIETDNVTNMLLANGSNCTAMGTTTDVGRSESLSLLVIDEAAIIKKAGDLWAAAKPTLATGGSAIVLSTPKGIGNLFHRLYTGALIKENDFFPTELPWYVHPDRDEAWLAEEKSSMTEKEFAQEHLCDFLLSGDNVVNIKNVHEYAEKNVYEPETKSGPGENLWTWKDPDIIKSYIVSADVARGDGSDYSAFHVIDSVELEQMAEYRGKLTTMEYAELLVKTARYYNNALIVVENNNIGWAVLDEIIKEGYDNVFYSSKKNSMSIEAGYGASDSVQGFTMSGKTRPLVLRSFEERIEKQEFIYHSVRLVRELETWIWTNGRRDHMEKYHDDLIIAGSIGNHVREASLAQLPTSETISSIMYRSREKDDLTPVQKKRIARTPEQEKIYQENFTQKISETEFEDTTWLIKSR